MSMAINYYIDYNYYLYRTTKPFSPLIDFYNTEKEATLNIEPSHHIKYRPLMFVLLV